MGEKSLNTPPPVVAEPERCSGCGRCISACPLRLYEFVITGNRKHAANKEPDRCNRCGRCITACPLGIIR